MNILLYDKNLAKSITEYATQELRKIFNKDGSFRIKTIKGLK